MRRILALLILLAAPSWAATYYVDCAADPGGDGTTQATTGEHCAWDAVADVNGSSFNPGDSILFKKGCTWREQLTVPFSGSAGNPITFGAYGTGADPIISGANLGPVYTGWRGYVHSDDFETGDLSKWDSTNTGGSNTVAVSSGANYAGSYGLRTTYDGTSQIGNAQVALVASSVDTTIEFRIRLKTGFSLSATYNQTGIAHLRLSGVAQALLAIRQDGAGDYKFRADVPSPWTAQNSSAISMNTWYKVKLRFLADASVGGFQFWLDDVSQGSNFTLNTGGKVIDAYTVGGGTYSSALPANGDYIDIDNVTVSTADAVNTNAYKKVVAVSADLKTLVQDGVALTRNTTSVASLTEGQFYLAAGNLLWVYPTGGGNPAAYVMEVPSRGICVSVDDRDYITVNGLDLQAPLYYGLHLDNGPVSPTVISCTARFAGIAGIQGYDADHTADIVNLVIQDSMISYNYSYGISVLDDADTVTVTRCTINNNAAEGGGVNAGVYIKSEAGSRMPGVTVTQNSIYSNGKHGIYMDTVEGASCLVSYNRSYNNSGSGIVVEYQTGTAVVYNIVYGNAGSGIAFYRQVSGALIYGNTAYGNTAGAGVSIDDGGEGNTAGNIIKNNISTGNDWYEIAVSGATGTIVDHNCFGAEAAGLVTWLGTAYNTYDTWETAYGGTTNSVEADPLFTNAAGGDFTLQAGSPCIEAGVNLGPDYSEQLVAGSTWPDAVETIDWHKTGGVPDIGAYDYRKVIW